MHPRNVTLGVLAIGVLLSYPIARGVESGKDAQAPPPSRFVLKVELKRSSSLGTEPDSLTPIEVYVELDPRQGPASAGLKYSIRIENRGTKPVTFLRLIDGFSEISLRHMPGRELVSMWGGLPWTMAVRGPKSIDQEHYTTTMKWRQGTGLWPVQYEKIVIADVERNREEFYAWETTLAGGESCVMTFRIKTVLEEEIKRDAQGNVIKPDSEIKKIPIPAGTYSLIVSGHLRTVEAKVTSRGFTERTTLIELVSSTVPTPTPTPKL